MEEVLEGGQKANLENVFQKDLETRLGADTSPCVERHSGEGRLIVSAEGPNNFTIQSTGSCVEESLETEVD